MTREQAQTKFQKQITNKWLFKLFLLRQLPLAFFAALQVRTLAQETCTVSVPYKWLTQNPFRSVYFAAQAMAAEMSTGVLCMLATKGCEPPISMLVLNTEAIFLKKATGRIYFTCADGQAIFNAVDTAIVSKEGVTIRAQSTGKLADGTVVSNFFITWTFKIKHTK